MNARNQKVTDFALRWQQVLFPLLIAVFGFVIYANSLHVPFQYDDSRFIVDNPGTQTLAFNQYPVDDPGTLQEGPTLFGATRQVVFFSFFLNHALSGFDVTGFHVVNILIHVTNALLVYWLVVLAFRTPFFAGRKQAPSGRAAAVTGLVAGLLFVSHPVQTQAVTYLSQRFASLATLFYLGSVLLYMRSRMVPAGGSGRPAAGFFGPAHKRVLYYAGAIVLAILAMRSKEISYTLPAAVALCEFTFFQGGVFKRAVHLAPMAATWLMIPVNFLFGGAATREAIQAMRGDTAGSSSIDYLFTQFRVIVTYLRLFFFPVDQNLDYDYPLYRSFTDPNVFLSFILLLSLAATGIYLYRRSGGQPLLRLAGFGILLFFVLLSVESSISPSGHVIEEHRLYLPSAGLIIALVGILGAAWQRWKGAAPWATRFVIAAGLGVVVVLAVMTIQRNAVWQDELGLWQDAAAKSPGKARPHYNVGTIYLERGQYQQAIGELTRAVAIKPDDVGALNNLGIAYIQTRQVDKAAARLAEAAALNPDSFPAQFYLGLSYMELGQYDKAVGPLAAAVTIAPEHSPAHYNLGVCYQLTGNNAAAVEQFQATLRIDPGFALAQERLQTLLSTAVTP